MLNGRPIRFPTTVTLVADPSNETRMMFCLNCQSPFTQYKGHIISVVPGEPPVEPFTMTRCKNRVCPMVYILLGIVQMSDKYYVS